MIEAPSTQPRKRASVGKIIAVLLSGLLVLLIALYFIVTSSRFLKSMVLPRVSASINAQVTADEISLHPFSEVTVRSLKVLTTGAEPLVTAESAHVHYDLLAILRGNIQVDEISLIAPTVQIVQEPDGKSNIDPLLKGDKKKPAAPTDKAPQLAVRNIALKNATVRMIKKSKDGSAQATELKALEFTLDHLANAQPGKATLSAIVEQSDRSGVATRATNDSLAGKIAGNFDFALDPKLLPQSVKGNLRFDVTRTEGAYRDLAGLAGVLQADVTPSEVRQLSMQFERAGQKLGQVALNGPFDMSKVEGRLNVVLESINRQVLNLAGAQHGWDFGETTLNSTNVINITKQGGVIDATGTLAGSRVTLIKSNQATPPLDVMVEFQTVVNLEDKTAVVQKLGMTGRHNQSELLRAALDRPMSLAWGSTTTGLPDSTFQLAVNQFDLQSWQALLGTNVPSGKLDLQLNVRSEQSGKLLSAKLGSTVRDLALKVGTNAIQQAQARFDANAQIEDLKRVKLDQYQFDLQQRNRSLAKGTGSGRFDISNQEINLQTVIEASLPDLLAQFPIADARVTNGAVKLSTTYAQLGGKQSAAGNLQLANFTGQYSQYALQDFQTALDYNVEIAAGLIQIQQAKAAFQKAGAPGGTVELSGQYHLTNKTGQVAFKLVDLNQNTLIPFLAPSLGKMKLISASLNGIGSANYDPKGDSSLKADLNLSNWLAEDPKLELPKTPLAAQLQVDGSSRHDNVDLRKMNIALRQGAASAGEIDLTGKYNLSNHVAQVMFKIAALDQTALRPALASSLGENKLISVAVNANGSAAYDPKGDSALKADFNVANLVVQDPKQTLPKTPLSAQLQIDSSLGKQVLDLRQFLVSLAPTPRAKNQLQIQGRLDLNKTNAAPSRLTIRSESLDVTPYYDLFAVTAATNAPAASAKAPAKPVSAAAPSASVQSKEPEPLALPFQQLTGELKIDRFYLRELAMTNLQTVAKIDRGVVTLKPIQMVLNGTPVNASVVANVSVPGYQYDLALDTDRLPIAPVVNSFSPDLANRYRGDLIAHAKVKGAGATGASLQKSLAGGAFVSLTNMNLEIVGPKIRRLLEPIALVLRVPELTQTPINWVAANTTMGQSRVDVSQFSVLSHAFYAEGQGVMQIAEVLTNSPLNIPINLSLRRSLAEKARIVPLDAPTNTAYVQLPTFVTLAGTLGDPKVEINKLAIAGLLLQSAGNIPKVGGEAGAILQGIGGILSGQKPSLVNTNVSKQTNSVPNTNRPPAINPLDLLKIIPKKK
jgi:hypothetical protein